MFNDSLTERVYHVASFKDAFVHQFIYILVSCRVECTVDQLCRRDVVGVTLLVTRNWRATPDFHGLAFLAVSLI